MKLIISRIKGNPKNPVKGFGVIVDDNDNEIYRFGTQEPASAKNRLPTGTHTGQVTGTYITLTTTKKQTKLCKKGHHHPDNSIQAVANDAMMLRKFRRYFQEQPFEVEIQWIKQEQPDVNELRHKA